MQPEETNTEKKAEKVYLRRGTEVKTEGKEKSQKTKMRREQLLRLQYVYFKHGHHK